MTPFFPLSLRCGAYVTFCSEENSHGLTIFYKSINKRNTDSPRLEQNFWHPAVDGRDTPPQSHRYFHDSGTVKPASILVCGRLRQSLALRLRCTLTWSPAGVGAASTASALMATAASAWQGRGRGPALGVGALEGGLGSKPAARVAAARSAVHGPPLGSAPAGPRSASHLRTVGLRV